MTTDQIETRQVSVRPEWHSRMGPSLVLQASTDASASNSDETATRHVRSTDSIVSVGSDPRAQPLLGWSVSTQWQQFTGSELDRHVRKALGTVLFNPGGSLGYSLYSGREQNDLQDGNSSAASIWGAGVRWIPHERIAIAGTAGKRFFGTEYAVAIAYRRPLSAIRLTAVRDVGYLGNRMETGNVSPFVGMLTDLLRSNLPDPVARETVVRGRLREAAIPYTLGAPLDSATATPFLNQRLEFAYLYSGIRDTFTVSLGFRKQNAFPGNSTPQTLAFESTRQKNAGATWAHRLTRSVSLNYNFQFVQTEDLRLESRQTLQRLHTLSTATQLTPRTTLSFLARRLDLQSTAIRSYVENSLACNLETRF